MSRDSCQILISTRRTSGFTLIEALVSIAIVGLLLALLIPAVQSARESARRAQCRSNLHQIGLALHNYESSYKTFPACGVMGINWEVAILPQMDQAALYQQVDYLAADRTANLKAIPVRSYICPSDASPEVRRGEIPIAATSYLGNSGNGVSDHGPNGVFNHFESPFPDSYSEGPVRFADVTDGLSATAAVSECLHSVGAYNGDRLRTVWNTPTAFPATEVSQFIARCESIPAQPTAYGWQGSPIAHGYQWVFGDIGYSTYNHMLTPMQPSCFNGTQVQDGIYSAASAHSSSVNVLFCDGHVGQVPSNVDRTVWRGIGSRNGSESIEVSF